MNGHSCYFRRYRVPAATQSTIPAFRLLRKSVFRDSHHNVSFLNSSNITNRQPENLLSKKPKHYTIERQLNRFRLGETPKKTLRFFLLAAATHTTIQTPKHPCNPKTGEVAHKQGLERVSNTLPDTKTPSQGVLEVLKNLQKTSRNLKNLRIPLSRAPKRGRKAPKALANKDKPRQRAAEQ